ncbi:RagB/SusD family nutrient uptake outer membrane protein [Flavobacterium sp. W22_SRS_FP1]|uniref:RagB/SusD family nutrient uptake outer membrane protein n=1 Tax=Flavobacterium sp. W22_SRS_FP1 TaxID=3240276 RepID=UPI003F935EE9
MKKIILILGVIVTTFSSCSSYIEEENLSNVTAESFYVTKDGFKALVNSNYSQLREIYGGEPWLFCAGTDLYAKGRGIEPVGLSQYTGLIPSSEGVDQLYNSCYQAIQTANMALHFSTITEETSDISAIVGELKFLRANAYFLLVQTYGGVSIVTEYISSPVLSFERNSAEEVYVQIITDLEAALTSVGSGAYNGKVNKRAVQDLLAKVYLTRGYETFASASDFATAASYADAAIGGQLLSLASDQLFKPGNDNNAETIFSVQYDKGSVSIDPLNLGNQQFYYFSSYLGGTEVAGKMPNRSYTLCPTDFALSLFTKDDKRWGATFMTEIYESYYDYYRVADHSKLKVLDFYEPQWFTALDKANYLATANLSASFEYHPWGEYSADHSVINSFDYSTIPVRKFDDPLTTTPFSAGKVSTRDVILSRLGETYLIAAEAYLQTTPATGLDRLNEVRKRAGVTAATLGDFDIDYILDERGRELLGEYHRWFDLKRTGKLVERAAAHNYLIETSNFAGANGALKILRPIPQGALDLNQNKDFAQNPGY